MGYKYLPLSDPALFPTLHRPYNQFFYSRNLFVLGAAELRGKPCA
jgi:hypothetical protein